MHSFLLGLKLQESVQLYPLSEEMAKVVLWRWKTATKWNEGKDQQVFAQLKSDEVEYRAVSNLLEKMGVNGLPLALQNMGSYVYSADISFAYYLELYEGMESQVSLRNILQMDIDSGIIREEQREIWKTWRISLEKLSTNARKVLNVMALFGTVEIPARLMSMIIDCIQTKSTTCKVAYTNWLKMELVNKVSLVRVEESN